MSQPNMGWLYYKELYRKGDDETHIASTLQKLFKQTYKSAEKPIGRHSFELKTIYPGLIIGSGYTHGISSDEDAKTGFYFDYTTGIPVIPGSSVKGVLRSLFGLPQKNQTEKYKEEKETLIKTLLEDEETDVTALSREIFEGIDPGNNQPLPVYRRDKFFDAQIVQIGEDGLLTEDYITPHKEPLKNPIPIKIIKIAPGVTFRFNFDFKDGVITANQKEELALKLLQFAGIGAKTNVGYGQFEEWSEEEWKTYNSKRNRDALKSLDSEFEKLKIKLEQKMIKKAKSIHDAIKKIERLSDNEKTVLKNLVDEIISDKNGKWYKNIKKLL